MQPIPEAGLLAQLECFRGFTYSLGEPRYPTPLPGVRVPMAPPDQTNCCAFVEGLIIPTADRWLGAEWGLHQHKQMMIMGGDLFSPIAALITAGLATAIDPEGPPGRWAVVQGWNQKRTRGHTFIVARHDRESDTVLTLEANNAFGLNGVGHRGLGPIDNWPTVELDARLIGSPYTWADFRHRYPDMAVCALHVG